MLSTRKDSVPKRIPGQTLGSNELAIYRRLVEPAGPKLLTMDTAEKILKGRVLPGSLAHTLASLESKRLLRRVGKGVYLNGGNGSLPQVVETVPWVFEGSRYYMGLNAMANHWGLSPQLPHGHHVVYLPRSRAHAKRVERWCSMLEKYQRELGGRLLPVAARSGLVKAGVSQTILGGAQLPASTLERTVVDSVVYTDRVGGVAEALLWARTAVNKPADYNEIGLVVEEVQEKIGSVVGRVGLLLEAASRSLADDSEKSAFLGTLLKELESRVARTRSTYGWGPQKRGTEYVSRWHLNVASSLLDELNGGTSAE